MNAFYAIAGVLVGAGLARIGIAEPAWAVAIIAGCAGIAVGMIVETSK